MWDTDVAMRSFGFNFLLQIKENTKHKSNDRLAKYPLICGVQINYMTIFDHLIQYFGCISLILVFIYGTRNYLVTLIAGFITFCVFYFSFGIKEFEWTFGSILQYLKDAVIVYIVSFVIVVIIYKVFPLKRPILQKVAQ
jgi:hypothetical protein